MNKFDQFLKGEIIVEKSINRFFYMMENHDIATISGWRKEIKAQHPGISLWYGYQQYLETGEQVKRNSKDSANKELVRMLQNLKYGVTKVQGGYPENNNGKVKLNDAENSFIVVNLNNDPSFHQNLIKIAGFFNQDSVGFIDKGTEGNFYLVTTNDSDENSPYGTKFSIGKMKNVNTIEYFFTKIKGHYLSAMEESLNSLTNRNFHDFFDSTDEMFEDEKNLNGWSRLAKRKQTYENLKSLDIKEARDFNGHTDEERRQDQILAEENNAKTTRPSKLFQNLAKF